jgi:glycosyltransferase involved in cell wall biosynthesis
MNIAFDTGAIEDLNSVRGIGSYTQNLQKELNKYKDSLGINFVKKGFNPNSYKLVHYPYFDLFFHTLPIRCKARRIVTIHDVIPLIFPDKFPTGIKGNINFRLQKLALGNVDFVICDSETSKNDVIKKLHVPPEKVKVIYLAAADAYRKIANNGSFDPVKLKYNLPDKFSLYAGDINWNKNLNGLLKSVAIAKIPLVMAGSALMDKNLVQVRDLEALISELGIGNLIKRTGFIPEKDLVVLYNLAEVVVMPSFYEGFGLPVLEGMACGTPVVCSKNSSLAEIGENAAVFCNPLSPQDIAQKILEVINLSEKEKTTLSAKCLKRAKEFSWEKTAKETIEIYKHVLS